MLHATTRIEMSTSQSTELSVTSCIMITPSIVVDSNN